MGVRAGATTRANTSTVPARNNARAQTPIVAPEVVSSGLAEASSFMLQR
jgi:hypothetical protein